MKEQKVNVDGFLSEVVFINKEAIGYDLFDLREKRSVPFIRREGQKNWQRIGPYFFIPQGFAHARKIIFRGKDADLLVVDEVGHLELAQKGLWSALEKVLFRPLTKLLLVVRKTVLEDFLKVLKGKEVRIFDIKEKEIFSQIIKEIKSQNN